MRKLILGALAVAAAMAAGLATAGASNRFPWCMVVQDRSGIWACAFDTFEQCLAEARPGNQGFCARNPFYQAPPHAASSPMRARKRVHHTGVDPR